MQIRAIFYGHLSRGSPFRVRLDFMVHQTNVGNNLSVILVYFQSDHKAVNIT